jgi:hypothetical protein
MSSGYLAFDGVKDQVDSALHERGICIALLLA